MEKLSTIFNDILEIICNGRRDEKLQEKIDTIEKALNDIDRLKQENEMLVGFGGHFFDESFKQDKVLKIIKDRFSIQFQKVSWGEKENLGYYGIMQIGINPIYIKTKEEYELLKEVLGNGKEN